MGSVAVAAAALTSVFNEPKCALTTLFTSDLSVFEACRVIVKPPVLIGDPDVGGLSNLLRILTYDF
jgi:hypothetical protein